MDPEITPEVTIETDDFADAFAELQVPAIVTPPVTEKPAVVAETPPVVTETPAVVAETPPVVTETPAVVPDTAAEIAALRAQIEALQKPAPAVETPAPVTPEPAAPVYNAAEQAVIDKYRADWPDIHAGEALVRRAEYRELISYVFSQIKPSLDALTEATQSTSSRTQYQDLTALVPDYDAVRDKTLAWVETQPAYLKRAYQEVANSGSAADVADLINRFKKETGYVQPAAPAAAVPPAAVVPPVTNAALPPAAAAAVAALKVVKSSRSEATTPVDTNDFDSAFAEFAKAK